MSRSPAVLAVLVATGAFAIPAAAQEQAPALAPPPPSGYAPPAAGFGPAPPGYLPTPSVAPPPGYAPPSGYYAPVYVAPRFRAEDMERRSTGAMAGGITLTSLGGIGLVSGIVLWAVSGTCFGLDDSCHNDNIRGAGIALTVGGAAAVAVGIPLTIWGAKKIPRSGEVETASVPELRLGPGGGSVGMRF